MHVSLKCCVENDAFPAGGFDSLSAVELSSTLSTSMGPQLPGTLVFDYPSVSAMAHFIREQLAPRHADLPAAGNDAVPSFGSELVTSGHLGSSSVRPGSQMISVVMASRLPSGYSGVAGEAVVGGADGVSMVPWGRWDLDALRVSMWGHKLLRNGICEAQRTSCI